MLNEFLLPLILAVIQGVTEWFPVSSSGHLVIFERILGYSGGLLFEVALHFGTLMAVFVYFGKDIVDIIRDFVRFRWNTEHGRIGCLLIVASIPAAVVGYFLASVFDSFLTNLVVVGFGFAITGVLLIIASFDFRKSDKKFGFGKAFLVGIAQAVAIIPGISRSGATISSGVLLGLSERGAMRFSFLMSVPIIFGANLLTIGNKSLSSDLIWATLVSFIVGLLTIHFTFRYLLVKKKNFRWFGAYALLLSLAIILYELLN